MRRTSLHLQEQFTVRDELRAALSLLRPRQVREFVLSADALVGAAVVTANSAQSQAFAMSMKLKVDFANEDILDDNFSCTMASNWLFLPAVEQKSYTLGIQFAKEESPARFDLYKPGVATTQFLRYIHAPERGYVSVGFFQDGVELFYWPYWTQTFRSRYCNLFRFNTDQFNAAMAAAFQADADPDLDALMNCLVVVHTVMDSYHCPLCGATPSKACDCVLPATRPTHMTLRQKLYSTRGEPEGTCVLDLRAGGVSYRTMRSTQHTIFSMPDHSSSLESQLISWAAHDRLRVLSPSLPKLVMPSNGAPRPEIVSTDPAHSVKSIRKVHLISTADAASSLLTLLGDEQQESCSFEHTSVPLSNHVSELSLSRQAETPSQPERVEAIDVGTENNGVVQSTEYITEVMSRGLKAIKEHGGTSNITREQLLRIVPMSESTIAKTFRRAKCRESAAFANLRRKFHLQGLRSNIQDLRRRKSECDTRLQALLIENRALRAALVAECPPVPRHE